MLVLALLIVAVIFGVIELVRSRGQSLIAWAVALGFLALLIERGLLR